MGNAEAAASLGAAHRTLTERRGIWWDVFAVCPEVRLSARSQLKGRWLCIDSGAEKRRLTPIPDDWRTIGDADLEQLAERAEVASKLRRRPRRDAEPDDRSPSD